eukprot:17142-Heterococcus_DN1.PRE.1
MADSATVTAATSTNDTSAADNSAVGDAVAITGADTGGSDAAAASTAAVEAPAASANRQLQNSTFQGASTRFFITRHHTSEEWESKRVVFDNSIDTSSSSGGVSVRRSRFTHNMLQLSSCWLYKRTRHKFEHSRAAAVPQAVSSKRTRHNLNIAEKASKVAVSASSESCFTAVVLAVFTYTSTVTATVLHRGSV